ncbi:hypothetical protein Mapa_013239 [Marchantia paleacea]|nr:hypothetical protein Mapa_013239 [Marchantia paleacea]
MDGSANGCSRPSWPQSSASWIPHTQFDTRNQVPKRMRLNFNFESAAGKGLRA